jgi:hypothetical protein
MGPDRLQLQRFELKYLIRETTALAVRDFVSSYLELDEYGATLPNLSYPVHSLYLDSDDLKIYHTTVNADKNRFKLRLRYYESRATAPVYFEIKRRMNDAILKQRAAVKREAVPWLLGGHHPEPAHLLSNDPKQLLALQRFVHLANHWIVRPRVHVAYLREAWISRQDNSVRVTMDRQVQAEPQLAGRLLTEMVNPVLVFGKEIVLELKFTGRFPLWFRELVRVFNVMQSGAAKYADGVTLIGPRRLGATTRFPPADLPDLERLTDKVLGPAEANPQTGLEARP